LLVLFATVLGAAFVAFQTERGTRLLWDVATQATRGALSGKLDSGALATGVHLRDVKWTGGGTQVSIDRIDGQWALTRAPWRFSIVYLHLVRLTRGLPHRRLPARLRNCRTTLRCRCNSISGSSLFKRS
jgi:translocation and assembly module TamB